MMKRQIILSWWRRSTVVLVLRFLGIGISYLNIILLGRSLSVDAMGQFGVLLVYAYVMGITFDAGCSGQGMRLIPRYQHARAQAGIIIRLCQITGSVSILGCVLFILCMYIWNLSADLFVIVACGVAVGFGRVLSQAAKALEKPISGTLCGSVLPHLIFAGAVLLFPFDALTAIGFLGIGFFVSGLVALIVISLELSPALNLHGLDGGFSTEKIRPIDQLSFFVGTALIFLMDRSILPFLDFVESFSIAGVLTVAIRVLVPYEAALSAVGSQHVPPSLRLFSNSDLKGFRSELENGTRVLRMYSFVILLVSVPYAFITETLLPDEYEGVAVCILLLSTGKFVGLCVGLLQMYYGYFELRHRLYSLASMVGLIGLLGCGIWVLRDSIWFLTTWLSLIVVLRSYIFYVIGQRAITYSGNIHQ